MDGTILLWIQEYIRQPWMDPFWKFITYLGEFGWIWILCIVLLLANKRTRKVGWCALASLAISSVIVMLILKPIVARPRPFTQLSDLIVLIKKPLDFSFPSGHTSSSFSVAWIIYWLYPNKKVGKMGMVLASLIALSRLYLGVHYPMDVLIGFMIGTLVAAYVVKKVKKTNIQKNKKIV